MEENGFPVEILNDAGPAAVQARSKVPVHLQSCHTAIVDGYIVEGHVPVREVQRMLQERPAIVGIAVPGMPIGSPGMEVEGMAPDPFDVMSFDGSGQTQVFARYGS